MPSLASIVIDGGGDLLLDYRVPPQLAGVLALGSLVSVPLRGRDARGVVIDLHDRVPPGLGGKLKDVTAVDAGPPVFSPALLELASWISRYYLVQQHSVLRAMLPGAVWKGSGKAKLFKFATLTKKASEPDAEKALARAPRQVEILNAIRELGGVRVDLRELDSGGAGGALGVCRKLEERELIKIEEIEEGRDPFDEEGLVASANLELNEHQAAAVEGTIAAMAEAKKGKAKPILLRGVTGSGKTEVYLQAIERALDEGYGAILLVPEISLTPQTAHRLKARFSDRDEGVAILHSHLSDGERQDEWRKIHARKARVVIGARSAVFAPVDRLGLIVVDEEHEGSYKQESPPRYHGRDIAVVRGHLEGAAVLLGSATPSLESYRNAQIGKYQLLELPTRIDDRELPFVHIVDLRKELRGKKGDPGKAAVSKLLRDGIEKRLAEGEQTILFLNRRGFARSVQCLACGHAYGCPNCSLALTFHKVDRVLTCHLCGFRRGAPKRCEECKDPSVVFGGFGTQRVEKAIGELFPRARLARVDADTMGRKGQLEKTLGEFKANRLDILIGTQMIAKGLHFPNVTLVGVLHADLGLHVPDFRAGERVFQLLTQVAGRAGRGDLDGEVIVQTFAPESPAIQFARHQDFEGFAEQEMGFREGFRYPPYCHAVLLSARAESPEAAEAIIGKMHKEIVARQEGDDVVVGDPCPSPVQRIARHHRFQILLRSTNPRAIVRLIASSPTAMQKHKNIYVGWDVDPLNLM